MDMQTIAGLKKIIIDIHQDLIKEDKVKKINQFLNIIDSSKFILPNQNLHYRQMIS